MTANWNDKAKRAKEPREAPDVACAANAAFPIVGIAFSVVFTPTLAHPEVTR